MVKKDLGKQHTNQGFLASNISLVSRSDTLEGGKDGNGFNKSNNFNEYDPYQHRQVKHPTTNMETFFHLMKGSLGTGILAMPKAFQHAGYVNGSIGTLIIGLFCTWCMRILINCEYELCKRRKIPSLTYPGTCEKAVEDGPRPLRQYSPYFVHISNSFLMMYQIGSCSIYTVFIAVNVKKVMDNYISDLDLEIYLTIFLLPLILINYLRNLKMLAPLTTFANMITLGSFGIIAYYIFFRSDLSFSNAEAVGPLSDFPLFFGTVLFALEAVGVIMPLENEMKDPKCFPAPFGVLNVGMSTIIFLYLSMGFFGYLAYGESVGDSITLSLIQSEPLAQAAQLMLAVAIYISHALQCYVAIDMVWNQYLGSMKGSSNRFLWEYVVRTAIVFIAYLFAVLVPNLDLFISLIGSLALAALGMVIPAFVETCTYWYHKEGFSFYFMILRNLFIGSVGLIGLVIGTYKSLHDIIETFF